MGVPVPAARAHIYTVCPDDSCVVFTTPDLVRTLFCSSAGRLTPRANQRLILRRMPWIFVVGVSLQCDRLLLFFAGEGGLDLSTVTFMLIYIYILGQLARLAGWL